MTWIALMAMAACAATGEPAGHRIGTRQGEDGIYEFYDRITGESFLPTGFSYVRLEEELLPGSPHANFNPEYFDLDRANNALASMGEYGYNTVRVLINGFEVVEEDGALSMDYMNNLASFIRRVRDHGMQTLVVMPIYIPARHPENPAPETFGGSNWLLLAEEAVAFREAFLKEFVLALQDAGAPMNAVLGYDLSEWYFTRNHSPFSQALPYEIETIAGSYTIANEDDAHAMMREGFVTFCNRMSAAIQSVAPDALVGIDLFPSEPFPGDPRFHDPIALFESDLDYIGLQLYPHFVAETGEEGMDALFEGFGITVLPDKPLLMEEFGLLRQQKTLDEAVESLQTWIKAAEARGVRGWIMWSYDCFEQAHPPFGEDFWLAVENNNQILRALAPPMPDSIPPPQPIETEARVGVYIFPGWYRDEGTTDYDYPNHDEESEWRLIAEFAHPRPVLGFYDDSLPEVNDWHIQWAIEAGISWFAFDWYWNAGEKRLSWSLEKGFLEAEYNEQMDFCIHWCNHGLDWREPLDFSAEALIEMMAYMAEHYFTRPNYLTIDGRPVLMIWDIRSVFEANGGEEAFAADVLPQLNAICHDHGLKDLFLIHVDNAPLRIADIEIGDVITGYSYAHLTTDTPFGLPGAAPYSELVDALPSHWDRIIETARLPFLIGTQSGWDSTPRTLAHDRNPDHRWVRTGNTADLFKVTLEAGKMRIPDELPYFLVEAWNEWGEGSFIEPSRSHGFGHLEAIRQAFAPEAPPATWHRPSPEQVKAYSVLKGEELEAARRREHKPDPPPPIWEPQVDVTMNPDSLPGEVIDEWILNDEESISSLHMSTAIRFDGIHDDAARLTVVGEDPHIIFDGNWGAPAAERAVAIRVRYHGPGIIHAEFFWALDDAGLASDNAQRYDWQPDGAFHTYLLRFRSTEAMEGALTTFRIDLPDELDAQADIKWVRLLETPSE